MNSKKLIFLLAIVVLVLGGGVAYQKLGGKIELGSGSNLAKAEKKAHDFIDQQMLKGQMDFQIKNFKEEKGLYKMTVQVQGQEIESYMTKDMTKFFPSPVDMEEVAGESEEKQQKQQQAEIPQKENPTVKLFTQSFCPYGNQAEGIIQPVVDLLGEKVEIEPHYLLNAGGKQANSESCIGKGESQYCSLHGADEAKQDIRELCVYNNQPGKYWEFVNQVNQDCTAEDVQTCWTGAAQAVDVNTTQVKNCYSNNYLAYAKEQAEISKKQQVNASPTLLINGVKYQGNRTSEAFKKAICSGFKEQPEECQTELSTDSQAAQGGCGS